MPLDACDMLKLQRSGFVVQAEHVPQASQSRALTDVFDFVPDLVMALLISLLPDDAQLHRMLSQSWVRTWEVWKEWDTSQRHEGSVELPDDAFAEEIVKRFVSISMDQAVVNYPSDAERKSELFNSPPHLEVQSGDGHLMNCLTDSLLQGLVYHKVINKPDSEGGELQWRRKLCANVRAYLRSHDDVRLRLRQRDERNAILPVSEEAHSRAFLEHHRHSAAIVA